MPQIEHDTVSVALPSDAVIKLRAKASRLGLTPEVFVRQLVEREVAEIGSECVAEHDRTAGQANEPTAEPEQRDVELEALLDDPPPVFEFPVVKTVTATFTVVGQLPPLPIPEGDE
jgi:hypothetical protein